ncbi:LacI family DNA-binding transcriptional regulator [Paenibacillus hunanensis]|uniref:LacI family DNA-binding transcriptional regulator n=1 Tax=Paenibacillus hunanensis TaxID=539262 RepID=UPI002A6A5A3C|nr:LacI family DNA-binding transcriptional regulator [Paenibacillus hunanensis]WPP42290.1 LacI family DNA-binding transcriptional regulator [Paenibacillus hunanensis]
MTREKTTIQHIADALGISRNTASKALNDHPSIPADTRQKVIQKAIELKYKQFAYMETDNLLPRQTGNIALLTTNMPNTSHFGSALISGLEKRISSEGYNLSIHIVRDDERDAGKLPNNFDSTAVDGIVCIELFDAAYSEMITRLGIPAIFIDCAATTDYSSFQADVLLMENEHSIYRLTKQLLDNGYQRIGFVGDRYHCKSFYERWLGYRRALLEQEIEFDPALCILDDDRYFIFETDWMEHRLEQLEQWPQAFVCANDFIAVRLMKALKARGLSLPRDIGITGFDDATESRIVEPHLTTVHIYSSDMGVRAAEMLLSRIRHPQQPYYTAHMQTHVLIRDSAPALTRSAGLISPSS